MNLVNENQSCNNAYYFEICILQSLCRMGYISQKDYNGIAEIAYEDYESTLLLNWFYYKKSLDIFEPLEYCVVAPE